MPEYLDDLPGAQAIWLEEIEHVVTAGVNASHASMFATYCCLEAACRAMFATGKVPVNAHLSEKRKLAELLGIGGLSSRTTTATINVLAQEANPYGSLPDA